MKDKFGTYKDIYIEGICQRFRPIYPGRFLMGADDIPSAQPVHQVEIKKPFWLADTACTQQLWEAVMGENPSYFSAPDLPVDPVSFEMVTKFLKQTAFLDFRLPTESEWEYACRAGTTTNYNFGDEIRPTLARYNEADPTPVKYYPPNSWGLYQMHGNVWEWTQDCWHDNYLGAPVDGSAWLEANGGDCSRRVVRGGSWFLNPQLLRSAFRLRYFPVNAYISLGFRIAFDLSPQQPPKGFLK